VRDELVTYARRYWTLPWLFRALIALAILGACLLLFDRCGAWWQNRETERVLGEVAEKNKVIDEQQRQIDTLKGQVIEKDAQIQALDSQIAALAAEAERQDERIQQTGTRYRQARRRPAADPGDAALDERLRRYRDASNAQ
jgi:septal ring factor EnvC (AmiA/AmiB activator)